MGATRELQGLGLVVARIVAVDDHPGARAPSHRLTLELGRGDQRQATLPAGSWDPDELLGRQVLCAPEGDEALVVTAHSHAAGLVLVVPDREVEDGSAVT